MTLAQQQLQADYEKLKQEEAEKSNKLQELMSVDIPFSEKITLSNCDQSRNIHFDTNKHNIKNTFLRGCSCPANEHSTTDSPSKKAKCFENSWSRFIPDYSDFNDSILDRKMNNYHWSPTHSPKIHKNTLNTLTKMTISRPFPHHLSLFHLHTLHLHLFLSLTLILVTKCPQYVIVLCNSM